MLPSYLSILLFSFLYLAYGQTLALEVESIVGSGVKCGSGWGFKSAGLDLKYTFL